MSKLPADISARKQALKPDTSFIIQAPAGSGKTGLLIRRFLTLLAHVQAPEEILAITFTRKATAEMRQRIINALSGIKENGEAEDDAELIALADAATANDIKLGWQLTLNTRRLRVQTIDSFCSELVHRMPWSARFGGAPEIVEDASQLYHQAAQLALGHIEDTADKTMADACSHLIELMNANFQDTCLLLGSMLAKRDKWMRLMHGNSRQDVEGYWRQTIDQGLESVDRCLNQDWKQEVAELAGFAAVNLQEKRGEKADQPPSPIESWQHCSDFPAPTYKQIELWRGVSILLLTKDKTVRKARGINVKLGFPPSHKEWKARLIAVLQALENDTALQQELAHIAVLPDGSLTDQQWRSTEAILHLLPLASAELRLLFRERNVADYTELAQRAELALGDIDNPSDLALVFDHRLRHLLMDEFQDTSSGQIDLVAKLLEGWQPGDGRTAFFVGDPMQSIYRFREAEVANFLDVQARGIAQVKPAALALEVNFRSNSTLVDWFNQSFEKVMPADNDILRGAVSYSPATGYQTPDPDCTVSIHPTVYNKDRDSAEVIEQESLAIAELVRNTQQCHPEQTIAVLARTRTSLNNVARALDRYEIPFQGIKLQKLGDRQAIQDLLHLTRALVQPADRTAWLSLMRMPWCGLPVAEVSRLCEQQKNRPLIALWQDQQRIAGLSEDSRQRLSRLRDCMLQGLRLRGRLPLWQNLEATWLSLGGPAAVDHLDLQDCNRFIELVRQLEQEQIVISAETLDLAIEKLWAVPAMESKVQLLTIHASKGLEFDNVILPNLERLPRATERELIRFRNLPDRLLIAAKPSSAHGPDPLFDYLKELEQEQLRNEATRLLYVACTRAKKNLHLFGSVKADDKKGLGQPAASSLLGLLWPVVEMDYQQTFEQNNHDATGQTAAAISAHYPLRRFSSVWQPPVLPESIYAGGSSIDTTASDSDIEFDWASEIARVCGIIIHQIFQHIDINGWSQWQPQQVTQRDKALWQNRLMENGIPRSAIDIAMAQITVAVQNAKKDPNAHWIFSDQHRDIRTEWPVTGLIGHRVMHQVIDRSFIDADGVRWIIDFKSSRHDQSGDLEQFIQQEKSRYLPAMERYRSVVTALENLPTQIALYYPVLKRFVVL